MFFCTKSVLTSSIVVRPQLTYVFTGVDQVALCNLIVLYVIIFSWFVAACSTSFFDMRRSLCFLTLYVSHRLCMWSCCPLQATLESTPDPSGYSSARELEANQDVPYCVGLSVCRLDFDRMVPTSGGDKVLYIFM